MSPPHTIRDAAARDIDIIVDFTIREGREAEDFVADEATVRRGVAAAFAPERPSRYWVAESGGQVVASISAVREWSNFRGGYYWWIQSLFIAPEHRAAGLVDRLLDHVADAARAEDGLELRLYAHASNARALSAYRRCGFTDAPYVMMRRLWRPAR
jgi:ribosomal protein S18 acetylase RimI-like enzyme